MLLLILSFSFTRAADLQFCFSILSQVRAIGMASPELLQLVENCPTGAETLIARILNIITDKGTVLYFLGPISYDCKHNTEIQAVLSQFMKLTL